MALGSKHTLGSKFTGAGRGPGSTAVASAHRFKGSYTHAKKRAVIKANEKWKSRVVDFGAGLKKSFSKGRTGVRPEQVIDSIWEDALGRGEYERINVFKAQEVKERESSARKGMAGEDFEKEVEARVADGRLAHIIDKKVDEIVKRKLAQQGAGAGAAGSSSSSSSAGIFGASKSGDAAAAAGSSSSSSSSSSIFAKKDDDKKGDKPSSIFAGAGSVKA